MIPLAGLALARGPSKEKLHYRLITAYYESGNRSVALTADRRCEKSVYVDSYSHLSRCLKELAEQIRGG